MTTSTLPRTVTTTGAPARPRPTAADTASVRSAVTAAAPGRPDRVALLALVAPLVLFGHGIVEWVDGLGGLGAPDAANLTNGAADQSALSVVAGALLVVATSAFAWLTTSLGSRAEHLPVAVPTALLAAFGAGATGAVWVGSLTGLLPGTVPSALAVGGQVITALALALVLATTWLEGRMPAGSLALAGVATVLLAAPWGLEPLGALVLLIALAPLTRPAEPPARAAG